MSGSHPELWKTLRWFGLLAAVVGLALLAVRFTERGLGSAQRGIRDSLDQVLGAITHSDTRIVEGRAEISSTSEISELSLIEMRMSATRSFENETFVLKYLPAGTKQIIVQGRYRVTAGYKLEPGVSLRVEDGRVIARFPEPSILSVELQDYEALSEKEGWANGITPEDRATLLRELNQQMRREAMKSGILDMADAALRTRLRDLIGSEQVTVERE